MNIDESKISWRGKSAIERIVDIENEYLSEIARLNNLVKSDWQIKQFIPYNYSTVTVEVETVGTWGSVSRTSKNIGSLYTSDKIVTPIEKLKEFQELDRLIEIKNNEIAAENLRTFNKLIDLLKKLGISTEHRDPKSKKTFAPMITKSFVSEFKSEMQTICPSKEYQWIDIIRKVEKQLEEKEKAELVEKAKKEADLKKKESDKFILEMVKKYDINTDNGIPSGDEILTHILGLDKYLRLAHYLLKNRGDWSDGCEYANIGLNGFKIESEIDKEIYAEISALCNDFDDGRVFRDCKYNYTALFEMADQNIYADYNKIIGFLDQSSY